MHVVFVRVFLFIDQRRMTGKVFFYFTRSMLFLLVSFAFFSLLSYFIL